MNKVLIIRGMFPIWGIPVICSHRDEYVVRYYKSLYYTVDNPIEYLN